MLGTWEHLCFFRLFHLSSKRPLQFLLTGGELQALNQVWVCPYILINLLLITVGGTPFILVQEYEKTSIKLADYRNHLHFNLRCSQQWLCKDTPPPPYVNTKEASWMRGGMSSRNLIQSTIAYDTSLTIAMTWMTENLHQHVLLPLLPQTE